MNATMASDGAGFDAALRALEDLETSVAQSREESVAAGPAPAAAPTQSSVPQVATEPAAPEPAGAPAMAVSTALPPPVAIPSPVPLQAVSAPAPGSPPVVVSRGRRDLVLGLIVGLALLASLLSAVGLIIAERTIAAARLVVADARERQRQLAAANRLVAELREVRERQFRLVEAQEAQLANGPVTSAELQHRMEALQAGLLERDPLNDVIRAIRETQTIANQRYHEIGRKMERVEAALARR